MARRRRRATAEAAKPQEKWIRVKCAFCRGRGRDPFGVMSRLSACCVCGGKGTVRVAEPHVACRACEGTGTQPFTRLTCLACGGKGVRTVRRPRERCPVCDGAGVDGLHLYCLRCSGAGVVPAQQTAAA